MEDNYQKQEESQIRIQDIPLTITLGEISRNVSNAGKIMQAIHEGRTHDAFNLAVTILNENDAIHDRQIDKEFVTNLINNTK